MPKVKRRIKLIQPRLQLKLVGAFLGLTGFALLFQCLLFAGSLSEIAGELPEDGPMILEFVGAHVRRNLLISFVGLLPLVFAVGVLVTFRIAGPLYKMQRFLEQVARGEKPADCTLRKGDELKGFCRLLNRATAPLREKAPRAMPGDREDLRDEAA